MLLDILNLFGLHTGLDRTVDVQRTAMLNYVNRAAKDLYNKMDADSLLREIILTVPWGQQVSLPPFIGELKGLREWGWSTTVPIYEIGIPRYSNDTTKYRWRNWTYKGKKPIQVDISSAGSLIISVPGVEATPAQITIVGTGQNQHRINETIILNDIVKFTNNSFSRIDSIVSSSTRTYDISIYQNDEAAQITQNTLLAVLYNNENFTAYNIVDVSRYSWLNSLGAANGVMLAELLYKPKFYPFINDTDSFLAEGFDDAIGYEAVALYLSTQPDKLQQVEGFRVLSVQCINNNIANAENGTVRTIQMKADQRYVLFKRFRNVFDWRRNTWGGRY